MDPWQPLRYTFHCLVGQVEEVYKTIVVVVVVAAVAETVVTAVAAHTMKDEVSYLHLHGKKIQYFKDMTTSNS
jgi:hypothetical protein